VNLREGTRRLALLLGVVGAIVCGYVSYLELDTTLEQLAQHNKFEHLAASDVVKQERKNLQAKPNDWQIVPTPHIDPKTGERIQAAPDFIPADPYAAIALPNPSDVNKGGIKTINWTHNYGVDSIVTGDGQTLYPSQAPAAWQYLFVVLLPIFGFFIPWGAIRAIGWVGAGFVTPS
jgi:hypothetical protein